MHRIFMSSFVKTAASTVAVMLVPYAVNAAIWLVRREVEKRRIR